MNCAECDQYVYSPTGRRPGERWFCTARCRNRYHSRLWRRRQEVLRAPIDRPSADESLALTRTGRKAKTND